jgi:hypothetical protein
MMMMMIIIIIIIVIIIIIIIISTWMEKEFNDISSWVLNLSVSIKTVSCRIIG